MDAHYRYGVVTAHCPGCHALATFEEANDSRIVERGPFKHGGAQFARAVHQLLRCANCGRAGLAVILDQGHQFERDGMLVNFFPPTAQPATLPNNTPKEIVAEVREAERCAAIGAWRAASAMLRSALEKTLKANGYTTGDLKNKIDTAAGDGVITDARKQRAHDEVRDLGNDVLHDAWREVTETEYASSHLYTQRVIEDFYDSRAQVEAILKKKGRLQTPVP
ncbi:MAG: DUF4145 domain-containing protein [Candidatus Methylomirabilaceae bacterium]